MYQRALIKGRKFRLKQSSCFYFPLLTCSVAYVQYIQVEFIWASIKGLVVRVTLLLDSLDILEILSDYVKGAIQRPQKWVLVILMKTQVSILVPYSGFSCWHLSTSINQLSEWYIVWLKGWICPTKWKVKSMLDCKNWVAFTDPLTNYLCHCVSLISLIQS